MFQSFWYGEQLSPYEAACLQSFVKHGHRFVLYTYCRDLRVPDGVECRDAAPLIAPEAYFTYSPEVAAGSHALFANLFRYKLLAEQGGWWVDTDVVCLARDMPRGEIFAAYETTDCINNAVLRFPKGHPVPREALRQAEAVRGRAGWGEVGPRLVTALMKRHGLLHWVQPMPVCYPVNYLEAMDMLRPSRSDVLRERIRGAPMLHLWNEIFRRDAVDKSRLPPQGSMLREIFDAIAVDGWTGEYEPAHFEAGQPEQERIHAAEGRRRRAEAQAERAETLARHAEAMARDAEARTHHAEARAHEAEVRRDQAEARAEQAELRGREAAADREAMLSSTSWRLTHPIRWTAERFPALRLTARAALAPVLRS